MADRLEFKEKLAGILTLAEEQNYNMHIEEVELYFEKEHLSDEQIDLVCDYLLSQNVTVSGYEAPKGTIREKENNPCALTKEEQDYLSRYRQELSCVKQTDSRMAYFLSKVVEEALKMHHAEVFLGDIIQEGSVSLMLALNEYTGCEAEEQKIMEIVRSGMRGMIEAQTEEKRQDKRMVEKVALLDKSLRGLKEELGRDATVCEAAERLGMTEEQIEDILKLVEGVE